MVLIFSKEVIRTGNPLDRSSVVPPAKARCQDFPFNSAAPTTSIESKACVFGVSPPGAAPNVAGQFLMIFCEILASWTEESIQCLPI